MTYLEIETILPAEASKYRRSLDLDGAIARVPGMRPHRDQLEIYNTRGTRRDILKLASEDLARNDFQAH